MSDNVIAFAPRPSESADDPIMAVYFQRWAKTKEALRAIAVGLGYEHEYGEGSFDSPYLEIATLAIDLAAEMAGVEEAARIAEIGAKRVRRVAAGALGDA